MIKQIIALVLMIIIFGFGMFKLYEKGVYDGIAGYHKQCHEIGGYIMNPVDGTVVQCAPLGVIPKEERKLLDKSLTSVLY